jgi:hypothetical protein
MKGDEDSMERARFLDNVDVPKKLWIDEEPASRRRRLAPTTIVLHGSLIAFYTMMFIFLTYKDRYNTINYEAFRVPCKSLPATMIL